MGKFCSFLLCAALFIVGTFGASVEGWRIMNEHQTMTEEQLTGEILLIIVYIGVAGLGIFRAVNLWNKN
jgi:hypothetical protein